MVRRRRVGSLRRAVAAALEGTLGVMVWGGLASVALLLRPLPAIGWIAASVSAFLLYPRLQTTSRERRRAATIGLRGFGEAGSGFTVAVAFSLATVLLLAVVQSQLTAEPGPANLEYRFASLPLGWIVPLLMALAVAPLIEETFLRGFVQGRIARRLGPTVGVCSAAAVFALIHGSRAWLLYFLSLGLLLGYARQATRSIWAAVLLHAAMNATLMGLAALALTPDRVGWWIGRGKPWIPALALFVSASMTVLSLHRAGAARRQRRQRRRRAGPSAARGWLTADVGGNAGAAHTRT